MNVFSAWQITRGNSNQGMIIVDTGADYDHSDLGDNQILFIKFYGL